MGQLSPLNSWFISQGSDVTQSWDVFKRSQSFSRMLASLSVEPPAAGWHPDKKDLFASCADSSLGFFGLRERSGGWRHKGTKCQMLHLANLCLHWLKHADMGDIQQVWMQTKRRDVGEWNGCWCCTSGADGKWNCRLPLSVWPIRPSMEAIHPAPAAGKKRRSWFGNASHLKLLGQFPRGTTLHPSPHEDDSVAES